MNDGDVVLFNRQPSLHKMSIMAHHAKVPYVMLCYYDVFSYAILCYVMSYYIMLCYVMICYVMLYYVTLCYVMICYDMLR